jgi:hypothetical protein
MRKALLVIFAAFVVPGPAATTFAMSTSANFTLEQTVVSSGGGPSLSAGYRSETTIGQPSPLGVSSSSSFTTLAGFWQQLVELIAPGDVNGDGRIDLQDAIMALQILSNSPVSGVQLDADTNNDQAIGAPEAIFILQEVGSMR